jgi:hypothetical protein
LLEEIALNQLYPFTLIIKYLGRPEILFKKLVHVEEVVEEMLV